MSKYLFFTLTLFTSFFSYSQNPVLNWGVMNIRLNQVSADTYAGFMEVTRSQAISMARTEILLMNNNISINDWKESHLYVRKPNGSQTEFPLSTGVIKLMGNEFSNLLAALDVHDALIVSMRDRADRNYIATLSILTDQPEYYPSIYVPPYSRVNRFTYQLVTRSDGKSQILKLDTTLTENKAIMDAYKKMPRVSIQHYPKFETVNNYLSENDTIVLLGKRNFEIHPVNKPLDDYLLLTTEPKEIVESANMYLDWNKMVAKPDGPVFSLKYLKGIKSHSIGLFVNDRKYEILSMRFTYLNGKSLNKGYYWKNSLTYPIELINELNDPFSILIDRIVIKDAKLGYIYIPQAFLFSFQ